MLGIDFIPAGLTSDGTYLFVSVNDPGSGNGTIATYKTDGTLMSTLYIELQSHYFMGLAWNGTHLWASQILPNCVVCIDLNTENVVANFSTGTPLLGLEWYNEMLWGVDNQTNLIKAIDPLTGRIKETFTPPQTTGEYGITHNGTHFLFSETATNTIHFLDCPTEVGEVWNKHSFSDTLPIDMDWNGSHYFVGGNGAQTVYILDGGTFEVVDSFSVGFEIYGLTIMDGYLYIARYASPYRIHKYDFNGTHIENYSVAYRFYALEYDGSKLWASRHLSAYIYELNTSDFSINASYSIEEYYVGLTYDDVNDVFWGVAYSDDVVYQLNLSNFLKTGVKFDTIPGTGHTGIEFDGEHLVLADINLDILYKIICIEEQTDGGGGGGVVPIPGFEFTLLIVVLIPLIGMYFLLRQKRIPASQS